MKTWYVIRYKLHTTQGLFSRALYNFRSSAHRQPRALPRGRIHHPLLFSVHKLEALGSAALHPASRGKMSTRCSRWQTQGMVAGAGCAQLHTQPALPSIPAAGLLTARMVNRSYSTFCTTCGGTSIGLRKMRSRALRIGGVMPSRASPVAASAASPGSSPTTNTCRVRGVVAGCGGVGG